MTNHIACAIYHFDAIFLSTPPDTITPKENHHHHVIKLQRDTQRIGKTSAETPSSFPTLGMKIHPPYLLRVSPLTHLLSPSSGFNKFVQVFPDRTIGLDRIPTLPLIIPRRDNNTNFRFWLLNLTNGSPFSSVTVCSSHRYTKGRGRRCLSWSRRGVIRIGS